MLAIYDWSLEGRRNTVQISLAISALTKISVTTGMIPFQSQEEGCTTFEHESAGPEADVENLELNLLVIAGIQGLAQRMDRIAVCHGGLVSAACPHRDLTEMLRRWIRRGGEFAVSL